MLHVILVCFLLLLCLAMLPEEVNQAIGAVLGVLFIGAIVGTAILLTQG